MSYFHQAGVLIRRQAIDVLISVLVFSLQEAWEALCHIVCSGNPLSPVAHVDPNHLKQKNCHHFTDCIGRCLALPSRLKSYSHKNDLLLVKNIYIILLAFQCY